MKDTVFMIPIYHRGYEWSRRNCTQLLADILEVGSDETIHNHFLSNIVYVHDGSDSVGGLTELSVIDGQQRLATLTLIYAAIRRIAVKTGNAMLEEQIKENFLINKFARGPNKAKLLLTGKDVGALAQVIEPMERNNPSGYSSVIENFRLFENQITIENYEVVLRGLEKLTMIEVSLDRRFDDPQRIFASLHLTGTGRVENVVGN